MHPRLRWYHEKVMAAARSLPESVLRELLLHMEVLRHHEGAARRTVRASAPVMEEAWQALTERSVAESVACSPLDA